MPKIAPPVTCVVDTGEPSRVDSLQYRGVCVSPTREWVDHRAPALCRREPDEHWTHNVRRQERHRNRQRCISSLDIRDVSKTVPGKFEIVSRTPLVVRGDVSIDRTDFGVGEPKSWNPMSITNEIKINFEATLSD
jgi:hypothetical protein